MTKIPKRASVTTRFTVDVTEEDIERAHQNDSYKCVVSQAVARTVPDATNIDTDLQTIRMTRGDERWLYLTPYAVQGYVVAFDAGEPIEPFSFQLRNPDRRPRRRKTEAGKMADRARGNARNAARRVEVQAHQRTAPGEGAFAAPATAAKKVAAAAPATAAKDDANAAARAAYAEARRARPDEPLETSGKRHRVPRVFKTKRRSYGHRLLRINQEPVE